jgi:hypothetical protein
LVVGHKRRSSWLSESINSTSMPSTHSHHHVSFFSDSTLFKPMRDVAVNCETFHLLLQLDPADRDLYWASNRCLACGRNGHRHAHCRRFFGRRRLFCDLLDDPHREFLGLVFFVDIDVLPEFDNGWSVNCSTCESDSSVNWAGDGWPAESPLWSPSPPSSPPPLTPSEVSIEPLDDTTKIIVDFIQSLMLGGVELCAEDVREENGSEINPFVVD